MAPGAQRHAASQCPCSPLQRTSCLQPALPPALLRQGRSSRTGRSAALGSLSDVRRCTMVVLTCLALLLACLLAGATLA